jgi:ABC-type uncharacterized transport system involved in gliding motility auxiliary subunit
MSKSAKVCFLIAVLILISTIILYMMTGFWIPAYTLALGGASALVALAVIFDWRLYWDFLTMRTTKHGMNMGALILLIVTLLVCVNYLAEKHNKTWDVTQEKLNSLSDQTTKLLNGLKTDMTLRVFYAGREAQDKRRQVSETLRLFQDASSHLKLVYVNAYVDQQEAIKYLSDQPDKETSPLMAFVEYGGKKIRIEAPINEASVTSAMIKATRTGEAKVYFVTGHGEKGLESSGAEGLTDFSKLLGEASFKVETLDLMSKPEVPADATLVAIVGPTLPYLDAEMKALRSYVQNGGRLFLALDPGQRQNLANLTKTLGIEFENNYIVSQVQLVGGGPVTILGRSFSPSSEITKNIPSGASLAVFPLASEVKAAPGKSPDINVIDLVKSDSHSFTVMDPTKPLTSKPEAKAVTVAVQAKGKVELAEESSGKNKTKTKATKDSSSDAKKDAKPFQAVVFGDSDFVSNRGLMLGENRDLAMNAFAWLAEQTDLISIRPKVPKGSIVTLTSSARMGVILAGLALPIVLLVITGVMWFRRRGA